MPDDLRPPGTRHDPAAPVPGFTGPGDGRGEPGGHAGCPAPRRFQVFDGDDQFVAAFGTWDAAHAWSHLRAAEPLTQLPVRIEDHIDRRTWTVGPGHCRLTIWRRQVEYSLCSVAGPGVPARPRLSGVVRPP